MEWRVQYDMVTKKNIDVKMLRYQIIKKTRDNNLKNSKDKTKGSFMEVVVLLTLSLKDNRK